MGSRSNLPVEADAAVDSMISVLALRRCLDGVTPSETSFVLLDLGQLLRRLQPAANGSNLRYHHHHQDYPSFGHAPVQTTLHQLTVSRWAVRLLAAAVVMVLPAPRLALALALLLLLGVLLLLAQAA